MPSQNPSIFILTEKNIFLMHRGTESFLVLYTCSNFSATFLQEDRIYSFKSLWPLLNACVPGIPCDNIIINCHPQVATTAEEINYEGIKIILTPADNNQTINKKLLSILLGNPPQIYKPPLVAKQSIEGIGLIYFLGSKPYFIPSTTMSNTVILADKNTNQYAYKRVISSEKSRGCFSWEQIIPYLFVQNMCFFFIFLPYHVIYGVSSNGYCSIEYISPLYGKKNYPQDFIKGIVSLLDHKYPCSRKIIVINISENPLEFGEDYIQWAPSDFFHRLNQYYGWSSGGLMLNLINFTSYYLSYKIILTLLVINMIILVIFFLDYHFFPII